MNGVGMGQAADRWRAALERSLCSAPQGIVDRLTVLDETPSTQGECRRLAQGRPGCLVTALRQTAGRGRLGRRWADDRGQGVALTLSVAAQSPERLSIAAAVALCEALELFRGRPLSIRWPNDIIAGGRKLAGILIEQVAGVALIGIGVNVNQAHWPPELAGIATSVRQLIGAEVDRVQVITEVIDRLAVNLARSDEEIAAAFAQRDMLIGTTQTFTLGREAITGVVERIDPFGGLRVRTSAGPRYLKAALTGLIH